MSQDERLGASSEMNRISRVHWTMPLLMRRIPRPEISSARISKERRNGWVYDSKGTNRKLRKGSCHNCSGNMSQDERLGASSDMNRMSRVHWTMPLLMRWISGPEISLAQDFQRVEIIVIIIIISIVIEVYL
ncbi:hypothetical protein CEXT_722771 [Caerostris extrusa]|uniref:Uncharacterized protein n=1 Tax=Caerostris extrusa TaxID=172846 RepID=A0AAV4QU05_CAEEX|nr:hypothetical protein CEXT_722771 [Caerostris extrusa]